MKSRQRSDKRRQRFSEDWQQAVLKLPDSTTNSTALSREITKSEPVGQIPINKNCVYQDGQWWYVGTNDGGRRSIEAHNKKNTSRMFVNGKYVPKSHPLYKPGRYKGFEEAAFSSLENYKDNPEGQVYVITNPAWEGWVKVGMAVDAEDRLKNYQTASPERDYELFDYEEFENRRVAEGMVHDYLRKRFKHKNEWFECSTEEAREALDAIYSELHGSAMMLNNLCDAADDFGDVYLGDGVWLRA